MAKQELEEVLVEDVLMEDDENDNEDIVIVEKDPEEATAEDD